MYIHELEAWPEFRFDSFVLAGKLAEVRHQQGKLIGRMTTLGFREQQEASLMTLTEEVQKSSEIEGEMLDADSVRSSIALRMGMDIGALSLPDRHVDGMVEMMLDAVRRYSAPLTEDRLFAWHSALFPAGRSGMQRITIGAWRTDKGGPMRVVSGPIGHEKVHYEAPAALRLNREMQRFLVWFNQNDGMDGVIKAALAHLWFVAIHPFDDGNGRIGRAIADRMLARSEELPHRYYSLSAQVRRERKGYYEILERSLKGDLDVTPWIHWFLDCLDRALSDAEILLASVLKRAQFWRDHANTLLNERHRMMLSRLLDSFEGKLTTAKWAKIAKCSHDTALRDIHDLIDKGILFKDEAGGRTTSYSLRQ